MGGFGSGRPGWRAKCENLHSIDVRRWAREEYLKRRYFGWQWTRDGEKTASIGIWVNESSIELDYQKNGVSYRYAICLEATPCFLGGRRIWFRCPSITCGRRAAKLYLGSRYFACRRCYRLAYQAQSLCRRDRLLDQADKLKRRVGGPDGVNWDFPPKPPRMRWRTYQRMRVRCDQYEATADAELGPILTRLLIG